MNTSELDARDGMQSWMRQMTKRMDSLRNIGRLDLLEGTVDGESGGLTVRELGDIPGDVSDDTVVFIASEELDYVMNPVTREWQPLGT